MPRPRIVTPDKEKAWIYGFYDDAAKEFLYVGQTLEPYYRRKAHVQGRLATRLTVASLYSLPLMVFEVISERERRV